MSDALIGCSGFVGTTLLRQRPFDHLYRSTNIDDIDGRSFGLVICAGAPGQKWIANREPDADKQNLDRLKERLETIRCDRFVLISTVDVFKTPDGVDEDTPVEEDGLQPYGLHRRDLEKFVEQQFPDHLNIRLPGLVGPGLRKNVIFDFLNNNNLHTIDSRGVFQFYPTVNLWYDIQTALNHGLRLLHLTAEPVSVAQVAAEGFARPFSQTVSATAPSYDFRSLHAKVFGGEGHYQYSRRETIQAIRAYVQSEPVTAP